MGVGGISTLRKELLRFSGDSFLKGMKDVTEDEASTGDDGVDLAVCASGEGSGIAMRGTSAGKYAPVAV
jgi:hypothetical protein